MGVIAKGITRGYQGLFTPMSLGYPLRLSVFNKNSTLKQTTNLLAPSESYLVPLPHHNNILPVSPPGHPLLYIFTLPPIALFLLSLLLSTPCFVAYVSRDSDPVRSCSTWAFTVCLCVCSSSPFLGPWGASA